MLWLVQTERLSIATRQVLMLVVLTAAARVVLGWVLGLGVDESYEVVLSRVPSLSYFDHPPLSFWIAGGTARLTGSEERVLLRLPFILIFAATTFLMFRLTARLYGERAGFLAALLLNLSPVFSISAGAWILPDGPLELAILATAFCLTRVLFVEPRPWRWWLLAGAATGLGLLSKYHAVFLPLGTLLFLVLSLTFGRRIVFAAIRWTNDNFVSEVPVVTAIIVIMGVMALTTHFIGVHTVLGAFVAGILVGESPILSRHVDAQLRGLITALFAPVFFGLAGLSADLSILQNTALIWLLVAVVAIASLGKFGGAFIGGRLGGLNFAESLALACGMNARGSTEVIVATIGLSLGMLNRDLFTVIVAMAVITTMAMPPTLRWALARLPLDEEERMRLEREEFEAKGFISNMERLLIAADDSANGKFAARLAGLVAGSNGMPTTIIATHAKGSALTSERTIHAAAQVAKVAETRKETIGSVKVDVSTRAREGSAEQAVADEARKGYDLLVIGIDNAVEHGEFSEELNRIAARFDGPLAIVIARGEHLERPLKSPLHILVPVTGTEVSREAAELGIDIAHATDSPITALYVPTGRAAGRPGGLRDALRSQRQHEAILKNVVEMADRSNTEIRTAVKTNVQPEDAIIKRASAKRHTMIVMGVNRRPGETLFFGNVAAAVLDRAQRSILLLSSPRSAPASGTGGAAPAKSGTWNQGG